MKGIVAEILEIDVTDITGDLCAQNCAEWDSAHHVNIILGIEDEFNITFDEDDFVKMSNFAALVALVQEKLG